MRFMYDTGEGMTEDGEHWTVNLLDEESTYLYRIDGDCLKIRLSCWCGIPMLDQNLSSKLKRASR
jgi:hypothetical protein